jgi:hypothetical protein
MNEILIFPDPRLRKIAAPITNVDGSTVKMLDDMLATMYQAPGIGLAANQVDLQLQLVVMDISDEQNQPLFLINPKIIESYGDYLFLAFLNRSGARSRCSSAQSTETANLLRWKPKACWLSVFSMNLIISRASCLSTISLRSSARASRHLWSSSYARTETE